MPSRLSPSLQGRHRWGSSPRQMNLLRCLMSDGWTSRTIRDCQMNQMSLRRRQKSCRHCWSRHEIEEPGLYEHSNVPLGLPLWE
jgi:hypothetical protein